MSLPQHSLSALIGSTGSNLISRATSRLLLRPTSLLTNPTYITNGSSSSGSIGSICSSCLLRSISSPGPTTFIRGKKKLVKKAAGIKVRFLKDIPRYGPKGSIMVVAPGRMRTIWYQRGEAEYLTLEKEKALGKHTVVERDPGYMPYVEKVEEKSDAWDGVVKEQLLTPDESLKILTTILPSTIRFYRSTINSNTPSLHGSVTATDVANAIKLIASASALKDANRVVVSAENVTLLVGGGSGSGSGDARVKELGEYEVLIGFRGVDEVVRRTVTVVREEEEEEEDDGGDLVQGTVVKGGGSLFGDQQEGSRRATL
ncbi:hypothetical protein TWF730_009852 [Orbilia blumenaviensis]|uniref:Ribosomal protein L9 domain-containing protein n=1 Tax=Orbilia blumenaviensis TaxID=1796055 RepID=A0AAV9UUE3_9PEZI